MKLNLTLTLAALFPFSGVAFAQESSDKEPIATLEFDGASSWGLNDSGSNFGPTAVEFTPIKNWLEIETGTTCAFGHDSREWDTDFLFKKPWTLSKKVEFMAGIGPEWIHITHGGTSVNSVGGEVAGDFMFWPRPASRFGWYLEPSYTYDFGTGHEQSVGFSAGLLIAIR